MPDAAHRTTVGDDTAAQIEPGLRGRSARVLLVRAGSEAGPFCRDILAQAGYRVSETGDVLVAWAMIEQQPPDAVLLDGASLDEESQEFVRRLRGDTSTRDIPVILLTPGGVEPRALATFGSHIDDCLTGPLHHRELLLRVRAAVRLRQLRLERPEHREMRGEQARMWNVLLDFSRAVARMVVLDDVLDQIVTTAAELTCSRRVSLMLPDESQTHLVIAKAIGIDEDVMSRVRVPIGDAIAGRAFASGRRMTTLTRDQRNAGREGYSGDSFVSMPIVASSMKVLEQRVGVLNITHRYGDRPFDEWELEFIDMLGSIAGSAIDDTIWRQARESLVKMERDLQVARRIQQRTFPRHLPQPAGFEIDAWSEPAEETGGDSYDVIGFRQDEDGTVRLTGHDAERAMLLLADATGHGIGPALSVAQVRAMLRMGVRMKPDLTRIVRHMNEQLCADLPRGRFITAWIAELDPANHLLRSISAGQGPIFRYVAANGTIDAVDSDTLPLGVLNDLEIPAPKTIRMEPGDVLAVISDGLIEAEHRSAGRFGNERAHRVVADHASASPTDILAALRQAVIDFTDGAPADDDRTAIIVKRAAA